MKAIILADDVVERLHRYVAGALALENVGVGELVTQIGNADVVEINAQGPAGALEIVDEWRQRAEKAEEALEFVRAESARDRAAIGSAIDKLRSIMRDVDDLIEDHPLEHADAIGVLDYAEVLIDRGAAADRELALIRSERQTFVAELERARTTERQLRGAGPAGGYGTLVHAIGRIRAGAAATGRGDLASAIDDALENAQQAYEQHVDEPRGSQHALEAQDIEIVLELATHGLNVTDMGARELTAFARLTAIAETLTEQAAETGTE